jgi:hypothetical protein
MTRRNNESRLGMPTQGAKQAGEAPPVLDMAPDESPALAYIIPTEIVDLPSRGRLYAEDTPLHGVGEIEIKEMTAKEEDILTTESYLRKGIMFDRLLKSLVVNKSIKVEDLLVGDRNALLVAARVSAYGADYETEVTCPSCEYVDKDYGFDLASCPSNDPVDLENTEDEELRSVEYGGGSTYLITLPKSGFVFEVRLLTGKDEGNITRAQEMRRKKKLPENALTEHFKRVTVSVNGVTTTLEIENFIKSMPAADSRFLRRAFKKITPNINLTQEFVCESCGYEQDLEVPISPRFFWPDA